MSFISVQKKFVVWVNWKKNKKELVLGLGMAHIPHFGHNENITQK